MLISASEKFKPLKKSKGSKRKEVDTTSRVEIVETLAQFVDGVAQQRYEFRTVMLNGSKQSEASVEILRFTPLRSE